MFVAWMFGGVVRSIERCAVWATALSVASLVSVLALRVGADCPGTAKDCGRWGPILDFPTNNENEGIAHAILMHTGEVLFIYDLSASKVQRFNPVDETVSGWHDGAPGGHHLFCCSHSQLPDGRIVFIGGSVNHHLTTIYDPAAPLI